MCTSIVRTYLLLARVLLLEVIGYYALVQSGGRARGAARRRSGHVVRVVLLIVRGVGRGRPQGTGGGRPLVAERGARGAATPRSPAAAAAAVRCATDSWRADHHAATSATSTSPGTFSIENKADLRFFVSIESLPRFEFFFVENHGFRR